MWSRVVEGRTLTFRLIGINNQNFLMEDLETRTWWQQVSGEGLHGPLKGHRLTPVIHDEVTFGLWRREYPHGRVLALSDERAQIKKEWERHTATLPVVASTPNGAPLGPRDLVVGIVVDGRAKAYPRASLSPATILVDDVGSTPIALLVGADGVSIRVFDRRLDGRVLELMARPDVSPARFVEVETGSEFDISGRGIAGPLRGRSLTRIPALSDYWFDWSRYHPGTEVHRTWDPARRPEGRPLE